MVAWSIYTIVEILYFVLVFINKKYKHFKWDLLGKKIFGPNKNLLICTLHWSSSIRLLGAGIFGNGFGSLRDSMFGQFAGEEEPVISINMLLEFSPKFIWTEFFTFFKDNKWY